jgi:hypothetical protein
VVRYDKDNYTVSPQLAIALDTNDDEVDEGYLTLDEPGLWSTSNED